MENSETDLKHTLETYQQYCNIWQLTGDANKTKIVIFQKVDNLSIILFAITNQPLEVVKEYKYFGIFLVELGHFINGNIIFLRRQRGLCTI